MGRWTLILQKCLVAALFWPLQPVYGNEDQTELIRMLQAQIEALAAKVERLETKHVENPHQLQTTRLATVQAPPVAVTTSEASWTDTIKLKGDFRYRHEAFDIQNHRDRHRQRLRARAQISGRVNDTVRVGFGLASGNSDPTSTNQTFTDGSSSKDVVIDLAYVQWAARDEFTLTAGKFKNPFHRAGNHGLLWDGDLNPEGIGLTYKSGTVFANALFSWVDESSSDDDSFLVGGQVGIDTDAGDGAIKLGLGYYNYLDSRGEYPFFDGHAMGNRLNADGEYLSDFELIEGFLEYGVGVGTGKLSLFADYVQNQGADDDDTGYALGTTYENSKWQLGYTYQDLEADAVLGTYTDSDFIGGGTDGEGHILHARYAITSKISLKSTLFMNDRGIDLNSEEQYKRLMLDVNFKY